MGTLPSLQEPRFFRGLELTSTAYDTSLARRHGGHSGAVPPQMTACAPQTKIVPPQARTVPRRN